ncbi:MAG: DUF2514 family protein [Pseudomonadota bacterium]
MKPASLVALAVGSAGAALIAVAALDRWGDQRQAAGYTAGQAAVTARWQADIIQRQQAAAAAAQRIRQLETDIAQRQEAADHAQAQRDQAQAAAAAAARTAEQRLRDRIAQLTRTAANGGGLPPGAGPAGQRAAIDALGAALSACAARYRDLAEHADRDHSAGLACEQRYDALTAPAAGQIGPLGADQGPGGTEGAAGASGAPESRR